MANTIVYVDGLNLYYGALIGGPDKWLDLGKYFKLLRQNDTILKIYYFTAKFSGPKEKVQQRTYRHALKTDPLITVVVNGYHLGTGYCPKPGGGKRHKVQRGKRNDVELAAQMLNDAHHNTCDNFVLVSGDSDLVPAVTRVKQWHPVKKVIVYVPNNHPARGAAVELRNAADQHADLPTAPLSQCHFPDPVPNPPGPGISKPVGW